MGWDDPAAWYEAINPWGPSDDFYLGLVMEAGSVLDVGCGTGMLLRHARAAGHAGKLCGLDPDPAMLRQAQGLRGVEWVLADAASARWEREFELATMTGHAFQLLITDEDLLRSLAAIRASLRDSGRFAFETRHPQAEAWKRWHGASFEAVNADGDVATVSYEVRDVTGDVVAVSETIVCPSRRLDHTETAALRFVAPDALIRSLEEAGFAVEEQFGDWERGPVDGASEELVTIARCR